MEIVLEILKVLAPLIIVLIAIYFVLKKQHEKELKLISLFSKKVANQKGNNPVTSGSEEYKILLPLKLQAFERTTLLLERIEPSSLIMRVHKPGMSAKLLHADLLKAIREEYEHNVTQQVYLSDNAWNLVKQAKEETNKIINMGLGAVDDNATSMDLSRKIFEMMMEMKQSPSGIALNYLKEEIKQVLNA